MNNRPECESSDGDRSAAVFAAGDDITHQSGADTGPGIAPEHLPHIFERFYRADKSRSQAEERSGLGLSICKAIVESAGGRIEVSCPPESGAVFTVGLSAALNH